MSPPLHPPHIDGTRPEDGEVDAAEVFEDGHSLVQLLGVLEERRVQVKCGGHASAKIELRPVRTARDVSQE